MRRPKQSTFYPLMQADKAADRRKNPIGYTNEESALVSSHFEGIVLRPPEVR